MPQQSIRLSSRSLVFGHKRLCRGRGWRRRRHGERRPDVPAVRPVLVGELPVGFQVGDPCRSPTGKVTDLRAEADDARLKAADMVSGPAVAGLLFHWQMGTIDRSLWLASERTIRLAPARSGGDGRLSPNQNLNADDIGSLTVRLRMSRKSDSRI